MAQELTFNITEDTRRLKRPTSVKDFKLSFGHTDQGPTDIVIGDDGNIVQGRYGDSARQVFVNVVEGKTNEPVDLTGYIAEFNGCIPDAEHIVIDNWDGVLVDPRHGRFRFDFPIQAFTVAGSYKQAYFRLVQNGTGKTLATLEFDMQVLEDFVYSNIVPQNYVTPYLDMINKLKDAYTNFVGNTKDSFDQAKQRLDDIMSSVEERADTVEQRLKIDQQALEALSQKIDEKGLFTQAEADAFKQSVMAELENLGLHVYDTTADLQAADLKKGQTARTLGDYALNDGGGATYRITDSPAGYNIDLKNGLKAEKINADDSNYYDEIKQTTKRINDTDVYFVDIPKLDKNGQPITPYIAQNGADRYFDAATKEGGYHDSPTGRNETPTEYARSEHTTLTVNGSASVMVADNTYVNGNIIGNGKILNTWLDQPSSVHVPANFVYVGIMKDRSLREFPFGTSAQQMLDAGVQNSWLSYWRLIRDGSIVDNSMSKGNEGHTRVKDLNPHLGLGIKEDGTLVIAACDGRTDTNLGLTSDDFAEAMKDYGCVNAWHMDGGGSTSVTLRGSKINRNIDGDGTRDRAIPYTFNVKKPGAGGGTANAYSQTGEVQQRVLQQVMPDIHHLNTHTTKWFGQFSFKSDDELENWLNNGLPQLINWIDYPEGVAISGIIATQYNNSAPGLQIGTTRNVDWYFTYFETGSHKYGTLTMYPNGYNGKVTRYYRQELNPQWTGWYGEGVAHSLHPAIIDPMVKELHACQGNSVVQIDCKLVVPTNLSWEDLVKPLPKSVGPAGSKASQFIGYNGKLAKVIVNQGGTLQVRAEPDTYDIHYVYLTNIVD